MFAGKRENHWQTIGSSSLETVKGIFYVLNTWDWMSKKKENREHLTSVMILRDLNGMC